MESAFTLKFIIVLSAIYKQCASECRQSYVTICDTISDFDNEYDGIWTDVMIKSDKLEPPPMVKFEFLPFRKLRSLIIVGQINGISTEFVPHCAHNTAMRFLSLYDNKLKSLHEESFSRELRLQKLSLINNQIEKIDADTFSKLQAKVIDLSDNLLEMIVSNTFENNSTNVIILQNNRLELIESNSFSKNLKILKLNNNRLRFLQQGVIDELVNLRGLYIGHNKFSRFPDVKNLRNLIILDASHNSINNIESDIFSNLNKLEVLDLSHNKLKVVDYLEPLLKNEQLLEISLAFNYLHNLDFGNSFDISVGSKSLILFGNPWWCHKWVKIQSSLKKINVKQNDCDSTFFNSGKLPFCISFQGKPTFFQNVTFQIHGGPQIESSEEEIEDFHMVLKRGISLVNCSLSSKVYPNENILFTDRVHCWAPPLGLIHS